MSRAEPTRAAPQLVEISRAECLALLAANEFGRVVVCDGPSQVPLVRPVGYRFDTPSQSIVFRTLAGSKFHMLARSIRAGFEVDGHDPETGSGWSVIVIGSTEMITQATEIQRLTRLDARTWPAADQAHWAHIRARTVTGRRLVPAAI